MGQVGDERFSIIKKLTVEVELPVVQKSQPSVEDGKMSTNEALTEKEDDKGDKSAVAEQAGKPEAVQSTKSPPVSSIKNKEDGYTDEPGKKQSGTNDVSPRATESISSHGTKDSWAKWSPSFLFLGLGAVGEAVCSGALFTLGGGGVAR